MVVPPLVSLSKMPRSAPPSAHRSTQAFSNHRVCESAYLTWHLPWHSEARNRALVWGAMRPSGNHGFCDSSNRRVFTNAIARFRVETPNDKSFDWANVVNQARPRAGALAGPLTISRVAAIRSHSPIWQDWIARSDEERRSTTQRVGRFSNKGALALPP